jgi:heme-degrading monooxygenase HmoA
MGIRSLLKLPVVGYSSEEEFLKDLDAMTDLAKGMKGFISCEIWKSQTDTDPTVYLVESEWETREDMSAMEHHAEHEEVMSNYPHEPIHLRLVPWVRPA